MRQTREIPTHEWNQFLSGLAEAHPRVRLEVAGEEMGSQPLVEKLPLQRCEFDTKGPEPGAIEIEVGGNGERFSHRIELPEHVWVEESEDGVPAVVDIEQRDHTKTIVRIESAAGAF